MALTLLGEVWDMVMEVPVDFLNKEKGLTTLFRALDGLFFKEEKDLTSEAYSNLDQMIRDPLF